VFCRCIRVSEQLEQAETYQKNGQYEQAAAIYKTITDYAGSDYALEAQKNLAILYIDWGKGPQAQAAYERLITDFSAHPALPEALYAVADKYQLLQRHEHAILLYQYIVAHWPESDYDIWAQMDVAISNIELGKDSEAQAATDKLLVDFAVHPNLPELLYKVADKYQVLRRHEQAILLYQYLVDNWPESDRAVGAQMDVAISNIALGDDPNAQAAIDRLIADFNDYPGLPEALYRIAAIYERSRRYQEANNIYQIIVTDYAGNAFALKAQLDIPNLNILSLIKSGNETAAHAAIDRLIETVVTLQSK